MHVRTATEIPDHIGALQLPHVPNAGAADIGILVERHMELVQAALFANVTECFLSIFLAKRKQQIGENSFDQLLLITSHFRKRKPREPLLLQFDGRGGLFLTWIT